jgi:hypothetical protein
MVGTNMPPKIFPCFSTINIMSSSYQNLNWGQCRSWKFWCSLTMHGAHSPCMVVLTHHAWWWCAHSLLMVLTHHLTMHGGAHSPCMVVVCSLTIHGAHSPCMVVLTQHDGAHSPCMLVLTHHAWWCSLTMHGSAHSLCMMVLTHSLCMVLTHHGSKSDIDKQFIRSINYKYLE